MRATAHRGSAPANGQDRRERESRCQRTYHESSRSDRVDTPASLKVAIDDSAATAARSSGSATVAPVPSPSRIRRSTIGSKPSSARARACARFGGSVPGLPPLPRAGRQPLGDQRGGGHRHAVEQQRGAPHRGLRAEARHRGQIGAAAAAQQPDRVGQHQPRPEQGVAHRGRLAGPARVVDPGPEADHGDRLGVRHRRDQNRCRRGVSDARCRRR